ncbi:MAG: hypothetical protein IPL22_00920 [Bacteroidetes bacterium]|nr:hypothetical protein [Bacteroidota bacterium]
MKQYSYFFDLDHTLWDFESNSRIAISELFVTHNLQNTGIPSAQEFIKIYKVVNAIMWDEYHRNLISKEHLRYGRFERALANFGVRKGNLLNYFQSNIFRYVRLKRCFFPEH